jgi:hypothetical protein
MRGHRRSRVGSEILVERPARADERGDETCERREAQRKMRGEKDAHGEARSPEEHR